MKTMYFVIGGIFTSTDFTALEAGGSELYGPFLDRHAAEAAWKKSMAQNIDICCHRLFVVPVTISG